MDKENINETQNMIGKLSDRRRKNGNSIKFWRRQNI